VCVAVVLVIQQAKRMRRIIYILQPVRLYHMFSTLTHKRNDFREKLLNKEFTFWFSLQFSSKTFLILRKIQRDIITEIHRSSRKVVATLVRFNETWNFSTDFRKISKYQISRNPSTLSQVVTYGQTDLRTDERTDVTKLVVVFRKSANAPKKLCDNGDIPSYVIKLQHA